MIYSGRSMRKFAASGGVIELASITYIKEARQRPSDMQRVMEYCMQEKKTWDEESGIRWVGGVNCDGINAITEFEATKAAWSKEDGIRFYQYVQSFSLEEHITHKQAHEIALKFAAKAWPGYEVLVATHCDTEHIHSHFVINSVSFENGLKLRQHPDTLLHLRKLNDEICAAHGFSTLKPYEKGGTKISAREYRAAVSGASWKFQLMYHIGEAMKRSPDKKTFIQEMKKRGYGVAWTEERKYITYTCPNGKKCRGIKLREDKYKKEMMEYEFAIREQEIRQLVDDGFGAAQCTGAGYYRPDPISAHGVCHPGAVAGEGNSTAGRRGTVPTDTVPADHEPGHTGGIRPNANGSEIADLSGSRQAHQGCREPVATGWESEREILYGLIQETLRRSAGSGQRKGEFGKNLPQMGAHRSGRIGGIFDAGLRTVSAVGRLTEDEEDEEEQRKRMKAQQTGSAVGTTLGLAIGALLAIRDEELRKEEAALQEELAEEQNHIWQLSM